MAGKAQQKQKDEPQKPMEYDVRINNVQFNAGNVRAYASVTLGKCFAIDGIRIIEGKNGNFVSMPGYNKGDKFHQVCFPVTKEFREELYNGIITSYEQKMDEIRKQENPFEIEESETELTM